MKKKKSNQMALNALLKFVPWVVRINPFIMLQSAEQPVTPNTAAKSVLEMNSDAMSNRIPTTAKSGQHFTPQ